MIRLLNQIKQNPYIRDTRDTNLLTQIYRCYHQLPKANTKNLKTKYLIYSMINYPAKWPDDLDLFSFLKQSALKYLKQKKAIFIFDASQEGFSATALQWYKLFYHSLHKNNIDPSMFIFATSNLNEEKYLKIFCQENNCQPINIVSAPYFEFTFDPTIFDQADTEVLSKYNSTIEQTKNGHTATYFSSLSRVNRLYRSAATFILSQSKLKNKALLSHDSITSESEYNSLTNLLTHYGYSIENINNWKEQLPNTIDRGDFSVNWATTPFEHIHNRTLFQIVNETSVDDQNKTTMFYSEKTFRPMFCFQPFLIYGQAGANKNLKELGYKCYDKWFDLNFDNEPDPIIRYQKLLKTVNDTCAYLDSLTHSQRIQWRFEHEEILIHNHERLTNWECSKARINKLLKTVNKKLSK